MSYVERIEQELGITEPGKTRVRFEMFDFGRKIGVAVEYPDGRRHAVMCLFEEGWIDHAIAAQQERAA